MRIVPLTIALIASMATASAQKQAEPLGIALEGYSYPYEVRYLALSVGTHPVRMAFMDVVPSGASNGRTVLLMHGRNFPASYWEGTIKTLSAAGFRVVAPDQINFGKSSKVDDVPVSFDTMAEHTAALLDHLQIQTVELIAHSMGNMAAARFTRTFPQRVNTLVMYAPVGLEDYRFLRSARTCAAAHRTGRQALG